MKWIQRLAQFMLVGASMMIVIGIAVAQDSMTCIGPTRSGCTAKKCFASEGQCNSMNWPFQERSSFDYRTCTGGQVGCAGESYSYLSCENRFYVASGGQNCGTKQCALKTEIHACTP